MGAAAAAAGAAGAGAGEAPVADGGRLLKPAVTGRDGADGTCAGPGDGMALRGDSMVHHDLPAALDGLGEGRSGVGAALDGLGEGRGGVGAGALDETALLAVPGRLGSRACTTGAEGRFLAVLGRCSSGASTTGGEGRVKDGSRPSSGEGAFVDILLPVNW